MPKEHTQSYHYCKAYLDALRQFPNLPEGARHDRARKVADGSKFVLTSGEYKAVNRWLDEQYPVRTKKVEGERAAGLFDDEVLRAE